MNDFKDINIEGMQEDKIFSYTSKPYENDKF